MSGIELSTNGHKVAWSIADYLATLEKSAGELLNKDAKPESKPDAKAKPDPKAEAKPEPKSETKPSGQVPSETRAERDPRTGLYGALSPKGGPLNTRPIACTAPLTMRLRESAAAGSLCAAIDAA